MFSLLAQVSNSPPFVALSYVTVVGGVIKAFNAFISLIDKIHNSDITGIGDNAGKFDKRSEFDRLNLKIDNLQTQMKSVISTNDRSIVVHADIEIVNDLLKQQKGAGKSISLDAKLKELMGPLPPTKDANEDTV